MATDDRNPVLSDLAKRLHKHQIGAITFTNDVTEGGIEGLLETLAIETEREGDPIGLRPADDIPSWPGVRLVPVGYSELALDVDAEATAEQQTLQLWLGLAQAAMSGFEAGLGGAVRGDDVEVYQAAEGIQSHAHGFFDSGDCAGGAEFAGSDNSEF